MPNIHRPRRGSLQIWPRKRAKRIYARIRNWPKLDGTKLLAFIGYKAGMTHVMAKDLSPNTMYKNQLISVPVTIIECPPLKPLSLRFYKNSHDGLKLISEVFSQKMDKDLKRKTDLSKKAGVEPKEFDDIKLVVYTQPRLSGLGKKKPEVLEVAISGNDNKQKLDFAKSLLDKEIRLEDVFKDHKLIDVHSVTKGKGYQGPVKRFGVTIRQHKAEKTKRGPASLGSWTPKKVLFSVAHAGQMGYHQRTEYNKQNLLIDSDPKKINPKSGFLHYGLVKNQYIMLKGSIPGPAKRTIILTPATRSKSQHQLEIKSINLDSKQ
ncbi:50S ribosomal protein L3 [Candidatus Woesearchaeota archaeon]|nr:50S ribosomal protein L3 [Candidatus Woesearchaeota archaeon]